MKALILLALFPLVAMAGGTDIVQNTEVNTATEVVTGDVNTALTGGSNKSFAFAHGMGDVDINQCLGSTQWGSIVVSKQKLVLNKWCAAESYDAKGMYSMAARMRCQIPEIKALFDTTLECISENLWTPPPTTVPISGPDGEGDSPDAVGDVSQGGYGHPPEDPGMHAQQQIALNMQEEEIETLEQRVARIERGNQIAARKAQARRDYAQMTIERLENDPEK